VVVKYSGADDIIAALAPERVDALLDAWDEGGGNGDILVRGPSLKAAITRWAGRFGMEARFDPKVPDLEAGEFMLYLPATGSAKDLDRSMQPMGLRARRRGRAVRIWADPNPGWHLSSQVLQSGEADPGKRLRMFLNVYPAEKLAELPCLSMDVGEMGRSRYTPRVEVPRSLNQETLGSFKVESGRPLGEQIPHLASQGLRIAVEGNILKLSLVQ
jgi:hypothetical protein